jgi:hypothetical protein
LLLLWSADAYEPGRIATSFIRFKLLLSQGDQPGVLQELQHMARCSDFCHHMLWVSCVGVQVNHASGTCGVHHMTRCPDVVHPVL